MTGVERGPEARTDRARPPVGPAGGVTVIRGFADGGPLIVGTDTAVRPGRASPTYLIPNPSIPSPGLVRFVEGTLGVKLASWQRDLLEQYDAGATQ